MVKRSHLLLISNLAVWSVCIMLGNFARGWIRNSSVTDNFQLTEYKKVAKDLVVAKKQYTPLLAEVNNVMQPQKQNTSLVIIMGNLRCGEQAWETLYKHVLDINAADLALIIGEEGSNTNKTIQPTYLGSSIRQRAKYIWKFPEYGDWADAVDLINGTEWRRLLPRFFRKKATGIFGGFKGMRGSGAIIFMIRWFLSQQLLLDSTILEQYERFVLTRADHYYQCPHHFHHLDLGDNQIWIPEGEGWGGVTDRHLVVSRANILDALDIFPTLLNNPSIIDDIPKANGIKKVNPEVVLKYVWTMEKNLTIGYFPRVMFTCASSGDKTRWRKPKGPVPGVPGLSMKYVKEYTATQKSCGKRTTKTKQKQQKINLDDNIVLPLSPGHDDDVLPHSNETILSCQKTFFRDVASLRKHISTLDLWVVSHGGVGSNYLIDHLESQGLKLGPKLSKQYYQRICHLGNKNMVDMVWDGSDTPALVIVGDLWLSLLSQHRRNWLRKNVAKNVFGDQKCEMKSYSRYLDLNPEDPVGIKSMIKTFMRTKNTVFLKAPYTKDSVAAALKMLGLQQVADDKLLNSFMVAKRTSNAPVSSVAVLKPMYAAYENLQSLLSDEEMPDCWTQQSLPKSLASRLQSLIDW